jgi:hypothetical protein
MSDASATESSIQYIAHAWHDWVYYALVVAVATLWMYSEFREVWRKSSSRSGDGVRSRRNRKLEQHSLWTLLAAAFLAGVLHYDLRIAAMNATLDVRTAEMRAELARIDARLAQADLDRISTLRTRLDPAFDRIFGPHLEASLKNLQTAIRDREMTLGPEEFKSLYVETLRQMKGHTLLALSYPTKDYFWDARMMEVVAAFVRDGGVMKRIFFLDAPTRPGEDAYEIMNGQQDAGVEVSYVLKEEVPRDKQRKFLVDAEGFFAWYVQVDEVGRIEKSIGTSDPNRCREYVAAWRYLRDQYARPFVPVARK